VLLSFKRNRSSGYAHTEHERVFSIEGLQINIYPSVVTFSIKGKKSDSSSFTDKGLFRFGINFETRGSEDSSDGESAHRKVSSQIGQDATEKRRARLKPSVRVYERCNTSQDVLRMEQLKEAA
jgi:hypothetical protein